MALLETCSPTWDERQQHKSPPVTAVEVLKARKRVYGPNAALSYKEPIYFARGEGTYLYDEKGNEYLDCVNNVAHLGHCHPKVAAAVCNQLHTLNTNSRYLHHELTEYSNALIATFPQPLEIVYMVNSGSEANDLALRICMANRPGAMHVVVMGGAYHGHTSSLIQLSPYKFWGPGGQGKPDHVHVIPCPDPFRGENLDGRRAARAAIAEARQSGGRICAFFCESILSCGGQIVLPPGYLQAVYEEMHAEGALCIADEVQTGFGRAGETFWAFETQGVVPDIVTLGKPIGNGYPVAALVTSRTVAAGFDTGMEYFNTYGGSTAAVAAARAVLTTLQEEKLQWQAREVGAYLTRQLKQVQQEHPCIGDVRGLGLMIGMDIVHPGSKVHAPQLASWIKERMKARRVLLSTDGPYNNVIKMKPPLVFSTANADHMVTTLRSVLNQELTADVWDQLMQRELQHMQEVVGPHMAKYKQNEQNLYALLPQSRL